MFFHQATGPIIRPHSQATIRNGGEQGLRGSLRLLLNRVVGPLVFLGSIPDE
jgi:hypothetical protein